MRDIATKVGVSVATVSRALRNDPEVHASTRETIFAAARELGYERNAYVGEFMSSIRRSDTATFKGNMGIVWGSQLPEKQSDIRLWQIQKGARSQAERLGFRLSEFDLAGNKPDSISRVLLNRGIQGVLIAIPSFSARKAYLRFDFAKFSSVCLGWGLLRPELHTVRFDYFQAVRLALHHSRHVFGSGIAAVWEAHTDQRAHRSAQASFAMHHPGGMTVAQELFLDIGNISQRQTRALFKKHKVSCLLVGTGRELPEWMRRDFLPEQRVAFRDPGEESVFGWIDTQNELLGTWGVDLLATKLSQHEVGVPVARQITLVPPVWVRGPARHRRNARTTETM